MAPRTTFVKNSLILAIVPLSGRHVVAFDVPAQIVELYPSTGTHRPRDGTYLAHDLRALAERKFDDILQVGVERQALDIGRWRSEHGLARQPAIAIVSRTLNFPIPPSLEEHEQPVHIITGNDAPADRIAYGAITQVIGGELFHTLTAGPRLGPAGRLQLHTLHYDASAPTGTGQWFASFDVGRER